MKLHKQYQFNYMIQLKKTNKKNPSQSQNIYKI